MADGMFDHFIKAKAETTGTAPAILVNPTEINSVRVMRLPVAGGLPQVVTQLTLAGHVDARGAPITYRTDASIDSVYGAMRRAGQELVQVGEAAINPRQVSTLAVETGFLAVAFKDGTRPEFHPVPEAIANRLAR